MDEPKKLRGFAAMTPEQRRAASAKAKLTREANKRKNLEAAERENSPVLTSEVGTSESELRSAREDPNKLNKVLDRFRYTRNPNDVAIWRSGRDISPVSPPEEVQKQYPELEWKMLSKKKIDRLGQGYDGWQVFKDSNYPEGIERSNDSIFGVRPKELGDDHRRARQEKAIGALQGLEEARNEEMEKRAEAARQGGDEYAAVIHNQQIQGRQGATGILIGRHNIARRTERLREQFARRTEQARGKKFFDLGGR